MQKNSYWQKEKKKRRREKGRKGGKRRGREGKEKGREEQEEKHLRDLVTSHVQKRDHVRSSHWKTKMMNCVFQKLFAYKDVFYLLS